MNVNADKVLARLSALDFMAVDLALYLDTHPNDRETIEKYNAVIEEADKLRAFYEDNIGPLYSFRSGSDENHFSWIDKPCPPDYCFNFSFSGKECC